MKRANGEGSIYKRNTGRWAAQVYVTLANGGKKRVCVTDKTREGVKAKLQTITDRERLRLPYDEKDRTVAAYLDYWMREVQANRIRATTATTYKVMINKHINPVLGNHKLRNLSVPDLRRALNYLRERGCSERIVLECLRILSACLNCAMREELVFRNVAQIVEKPKYTPKQNTIWTQEQATLFLGTVQNHPHYIAFLLFLIYGMRRGEVLGLRWSDIDFGGATIHVRQQIGRVNGAIVARDVKTKNSSRELPLGPVVRAALLAHAYKNGIAPPPFNPHIEFSTQGTVVTSKVGTPLDPDNLTRCFARLVKKSGLPRIKIHDTRHTAATILKDLDTPVKDAQSLLGHADPSTTLKIYQHGTPKTQRTAIFAVEKRLFNRAEARPNPDRKMLATVLATAPKNGVTQRPQTNAITEVVAA